MFITNNLIPLSAGVADGKLHSGSAPRLSRISLN